MYNDILTLVTQSTMTDAYGDQSLTETTIDVFCDVMSIGTKEFYQAQTVGSKPELKFKIADYMDYDGQQEVIYDGYKYKVLRTYRAGGNELEITVYGGVRLDAST